MGEEKFKLPRSSYEEIRKIIQAYGTLHQPASLDQVASLCAMNRTVISANNSFLSSVGVIEGGKVKSATELGRKLAKALEYDLVDEIRESWARIVRANEFLEKMTSAVRIRGKMESSALESHIAFSAGETKSGAVRTGARAVIDMLLASGAIKEHEGHLVANKSTDLPESKGDRSHESPGLENGEDEPRRDELPKKRIAALQISLNITATPEDLDGLGARLKKFLSEVSQPIDSGGDENEGES